MSTRKLLNIINLPDTITYQPYSNNYEEQKPLQQQYFNQQQEQHTGYNRQSNNLTKLRNFFTHSRTKSTSELSALHTDYSQQQQQQSKRHNYCHENLIARNNSLPIVQSISNILHIFCIVAMLVVLTSMNGVTSSPVFEDNPSLAQYSKTITRPGSLSATTSTNQASTIAEAVEKVLPTTRTPTTIIKTQKSTATPTPSITHQTVLVSTTQPGLVTWVPAASKTLSHTQNKVEEPPSEEVSVSVSSKNSAVLKSPIQISVRMPKYTIFGPKFATAGTPTTTPRSSVRNPGQTAKVCGRRMLRQARIFGGSAASFGRWPWQVSLLRRNTSTYSHICGATLLNENFAITAAHCVYKKLSSDLLLRMGQFHLAAVREPYGYQERRVKTIFRHPKFNPRNYEYDLALLRFNEPVVFQPNIVPICIPETDENFIGQKAFVTGWGRLYEDGPLASVLQEVAVPVVNNTICESMYRAAGYIEHIPHIFICAGLKKGGYDSCEGDSGGPMVLQRKSDNRFQLGGINSWGIGCGKPNQPGVYTRISEFRHWINQILQF